jgi:MFS family permease
VFFIVAGLFAAIGPIAGSYLTQYWTWRAIFWINLPVAMLSLTEFAFLKLKDIRHPARGRLAGRGGAGRGKWRCSCWVFSSPPRGAGAAAPRSAR